MHLFELCLNITINIAPFCGFKYYNKVQSTEIFVENRLLMFVKVQSTEILVHIDVILCTFIGIIVPKALIF